MSMYSQTIVSSTVEVSSATVDSVEKAIETIKESEFDNVIIVSVKTEYDDILRRDFYVVEFTHKCSIAMLYLPE